MDFGFFSVAPASAGAVDGVGADEIAVGEEEQLRSETAWGDGITALHDIGHHQLPQLSLLSAKRV